MTASREVVVADVDLILIRRCLTGKNCQPWPVDEGRIDRREIVDGPSCAPVVAVGDMGLEDQWQLLNRRHIHAVLPGRRWPTYTDIHITDIRSEQVGNGCLDKRAPAVIGTSHMRATRLPGDVDRTIGAVHSDRRLSGVGLAA